jgi:hypothetical protein
VPQLAALGLTVAIELPWYVLGLVGLRTGRLSTAGARRSGVCGGEAGQLSTAGVWRAALLGLGVNLVTHPVLWWLLAPRPTLALFALAELAVCAVEALLLWCWLRRDLALLAVLSVGANATSVLVGLLLTEVGSAG